MVTQLVVAAGSVAAVEGPVPFWALVLLAVAIAGVVAMFVLSLAEAFYCARWTWMVGLAAFAVVAPLALVGVYSKHQSDVADFEARPAVRAAARVNAPEAVLWHLARHAHSDVRAAVAANRVAAPELLDLLSTDLDADVRVAVASNSGTYGDTLAVLASDSDAAVRRCVGENRSASSEVLADLASDPDPAVQLAALSNPSISEAAILAATGGRKAERREARNAKHSAADATTRRAAVAADRVSSAGLLDELSYDLETAVRAEVAANPATGWETLVRLLDDPDPAVAAAARRTLPEMLHPRSVAEDDYSAHPSSSDSDGWRRGDRGDELRSVDP